MISRVDANLVLRANGRMVEVTGPISQWDADETSATFAVVIAQVQPGGEIVLAHGSAGHNYQSGDGAWAAHAHVCRQWVVERGSRASLRLRLGAERRG